MSDRTPVIVGIGLSDYPVAPHLTGYGHQVQAVRRALDDSGVAKADIDGFMTVGNNGFMIDDVATMAEYLQIRHKWCEGTQYGGSASEAFVDHAAEAIRAGKCDTVLITYGSDLRSNKTRSLSMGMVPAFDGPQIMIRSPSAASGGSSIIPSMLTYPRPTGPALYCMHRFDARCRRGIAERVGGQVQAVASGVTAVPASLGGAVRHKSLRNGRGDSPTDYLSR